MEKQKVILDTDIGTDIDDAIALAYLLRHPQCELVGITTLTGEAEKRAQMASVLTTAAGRDDIPIYPGIEDCLLIEQKERYAPQARMLANWKHQTNFPKNQALRFMQQTIRDNPGEITLLGISPMSNIARLFLMDPELPSLLKGLYLMCGKFSEFEQRTWIYPDTQVKGSLSAFEPRNLSRFMAGGALEMNALIDPYATAVVYQQTVPVHRSIGVDMTHRVIMSMEEFKARFTHPLHQPILDMAGVWFEEADGVTFHDPLAVVCAFNDDICRFERGNVEVEMGCSPLRGYTYFHPDTAGRHEVAVDVDNDAFFKEYFSVF